QRHRPARRPGATPKEARKQAAGDLAWPSTTSSLAGSSVPSCPFVADIAGERPIRQALLDVSSLRHCFAAEPGAVAGARVPVRLEGNRGPFSRLHRTATLAPRAAFRKGARAMIDEALISAARVSKAW